MGNSITETNTIRKLKYEKEAEQIFRSGGRRGEGEGEEILVSFNNVKEELSAFREIFFLKQTYLILLKDLITRLKL